MDNMARDIQLWETVRQGGPPTLRIYRWNQPAISIGRRQKPDELPAELLSRDLPIVRRPTGGGAVLHQPDELTYAIALTRAVLLTRLRLSRFPGLVHRHLAEALARRGLIGAGDLRLLERDGEGPYTLCFSSPVCGDLLYQGRKVAGASLRSWREGILMQGSVQGLPVPMGELQTTLCEAVESLLPSKQCRGGDLNPDGVSPTTP